VGVVSGAGVGLSSDVGVGVDSGFGSVVDSEDAVDVGIGLSSGGGVVHVELSVRTASEAAEEITRVRRSRKMLNDSHLLRHRCELFLLWILNLTILPNDRSSWRNLTAPVFS
jgi:hypothetical protein